MKFKDMPYERVDFEQVEQEMRTLMEAFDSAKDGEEQFAVHQKYYALTDRVGTQMTIAHIRYDADTTDEFYSAEHDYYNEKSPIYHNLALEYEKKLYASPYRDKLVEKIGPVAFKNMEIAQKAMDERLIPLMQEENNLTTEYSKLIAGAKIPFDGQELNLSLLRPYTVHQDRSVRAAAWKAQSEFFAANAQTLDEIYDKLVKNRTAQARALGYDNYLELGYYRMCRNCYGREEVEAFRKQVKEDFVPFAEKLHDRRRQRLGLEKLSCIDTAVYFKEGNPAPLGTPQEILEAGRKMYGELSPETRDFYDFMMENELFDVLGRKTKRAGGYMTYMPVYQAPFVFANFNGTSGDVDVITHECGHAFQGWLSGKDPIREHSDITMETAEIHSMSMEFFAQKWMPLFFGERARDYIEMHLEDAAAFIPYGCMVDEFQHRMYENPNLTPEERNGIWLELEKKYRPWIDYEDLPSYSRGARWQQQTHIYMSPFYYIDYCMAQTMAHQFWLASMTDREAAWKKYLAFVDQGGTKTFEDLVTGAGMKLPYEAGCIKEIGAAIPKWIDENPL